MAPIKTLLPSCPGASKSKDLVIKPYSARTSFPPSFPPSSSTFSTSCPAFKSLWCAPEIESAAQDDSNDIVPARRRFTSSTFSPSCPVFTRSSPERPSCPVKTRSSPETKTAAQDEIDATMPVGRQFTPPSPSLTRRQKSFVETITSVGLFSIPSKGGRVVTHREKNILLVELPDQIVTLHQGEMVIIKPAKLRTVPCVDSTVFADCDGVSETVWSADGRCHHTTDLETTELEDFKFALAVTNFPMTSVEARGIRSSRDKLRAKCLNNAKQMHIEAAKDMEPTWEEKPRFQLCFGSTKLMLVSDISREFSADLAEPTQQGSRDLGRTMSVP